MYPEWKRFDGVLLERQTYRKKDQQQMPAYMGEQYQNGS
jgi:hypothetical protein